MKIEIWSDIMCPFCYIGKRHFEKALENFENKDALEIEWKSFQLDPSIPEDLEVGMTTEEYLASRKGMGMDQVKQMIEQVNKMAQNAGLNYHPDGTLLANSFKAHRIIQFAKTKNLGDEIEEALFKAYFIDAKNLGSVEVLSEIAESVGLSKEDVREALENDQYAYFAKSDIKEAQELGISGVPFFVFDRKYGVSGAQPVEAFTQTLEKSFSEWKNSQ